MAGSLLFLSKDNRNKNHFLAKAKELGMFVKQTFDPYFPHITIREISRECFLIEFRKDDDEKFVYDNWGNWLTYEGIVFSLKESTRLDAAELLNLYKESGENFVTELDGHFVIKLFDFEKKTYFVFTDFIKNKTNYLFENEDYFMITPFVITTRIVQEPELDQNALNEFMWRYYVLSERTLFRDVSRLEPASIYEVESGNISRKVYWNWNSGYTDLSFGDSVEKMVESMRESAGLIRNSFENNCLDFTMGQDTRQVISAFKNQKLDFVTSTFGKTDFYEVREVKKLAEKHQIVNHNIVLANDYTENLFEHFRKAVILGSCEEPGYLLGRILYMREQQSKFGKAVINGADGHFYKNGLWDEMYTFNCYREPKQFNIDSFLRLRALSSNYNENIFTPEFLKIKNESQQYFREIIKNAIKDHLQSPVSIQVDRFDLYHWLNFGIASNNAGNLITNSISLLLLRRNLEFALKIPVKWKFNLSKFQRAVVHSLDPALAKEKTDFGGVTMTPKNMFTILPFYFRYFYFQSGRLRNKIKSKFGLKVVTHLQEAWDYLPLYKKLFSDERVRENLNYQDMKLAGIIKEKVWIEFIKRFDHPEKLSLSDYEYLLKILSVELLF